jgi:hypothetical protein
MRNLKPLSAKRVESLREPGVYRDKGNPGLLLRVEPTGAKRWVLHTNVNGRRRDLAWARLGMSAWATRANRRRRGAERHEQDVILHWGEPQPIEHV